METLVYSRLKADRAKCHPLSDDSTHTPCGTNAPTVRANNSLSKDCVQTCQSKAGGDATIRPRSHAAKYQISQKQTKWLLQSHPRQVNRHSTFPKELKRHLGCKQKQMLMLNAMPAALPNTNVATAASPVATSLRWRSKQNKKKDLPGS